MKSKKFLIFANYLILNLSVICQLTGQPPKFELTDSITSCLVTESCKPKEVQKVGDPYLYEGECSIAINRYLSKAIDVGGLDALLNPDKPLDSNNMNTNRNTAKYCEMIKSFVDLDIQMIQRAYFGGSYNEDKLYPNEIWYKTGEQIVRDINYVYDCANKRRPIIQGLAFEVMEPENFNKPWAGFIPTDFINEYFIHYPEDLNDSAIKSYYCESPLGNCIPKSTLKFNSERITGGGSPKINNVEWRMWYLYQAFTQIDMGYSAIHLGIYWSSHMAGNDLTKLSKLTDAIREYAKSKNKFVLLSGEPPMKDENNDGLSAKVPGTNRFIFDFDSRAMRPRELTLPSTSGDGNDCTSPISQSIISDFNSSPCATFNLKAVIDPCTINSFGGTTGGFSAHDPDCEIQQIPYTVHFDGFSIPIEAPKPSNGNSSLTYGFNDHNWFAMLPSDCQAWWYDYFYCNRREFHGGNGFLVIPGIISSRFDLGNYNMNENDVPNKNNLLYQNTTLYSKIKNSTLLVKNPKAKVTMEFGKGLLSCECDGNYAPFNKIYRSSRICYKVELEPDTEDCSSVYSVHIKKPDGSWLPQKINSTSYYFCPDQLGTYKIGIRQDYNGDKVQYGNEEILVDKLLFCELRKGKCHQIPLTNDCDKKFLKVNYRESDNKYSLIYKNKENEIKQITSIDGLNYNYSAATPNINFTDDFFDHRFDINGNGYHFSNLNNNSIISKSNYLGIIQWQKEINGKIIKVGESDNGFYYLISNNDTNNLNINSIDFNGNITIINQSISSSISNINVASFSSETFVGFNESQKKLVIKDITSGNEIIKALPIAFSVKSIDLTFDNKILVSGDFVGQITVENESFNSDFTSTAFFLFDKNGAMLNSYSYSSSENQFLDGVNLNKSGDIVYFGRNMTPNDGYNFDPCYYIYKFRFENTVVPRNRNVNSQNKIEVFPNPFLDDININIISNSSDVGNINLFDAVGKGILSVPVNLTPGENIIKLNVDKNSAEGMYFLEFKSNNSGQKSVTKLIKLR